MPFLKGPPVNGATPGVRDAPRVVKSHGDGSEKPSQNRTIGGEVQAGAPDPRDTLAFFALIWGDTPGWRCICEPTGPGVFTPSWSETNAGAVEIVREIEARGATAYHAPALFNGPTRRRTNNVSTTAVYWLDIDLFDPLKTKKKPSPYTTLQDARDALAGLVAAAGLPPPLEVASGGGLHVYWRLDAPLLPGPWKDGARALSRACSTLKLEEDRQCTTNNACLLRPPGTTNRKPGRNGAIVEVIGWPRD